MSVLQNPAWRAPLFISWEYHGYDTELKGITEYDKSVIMHKISRIKAVNFNFLNVRFDGNQSAFYDGLLHLRTIRHRSNINIAANIHAIENMDFRFLENMTNRQFFNVNSPHTNNNTGSLSFSNQTLKSLNKISSSNITLQYLVSNNFSSELLSLSDIAKEYNVKQVNLIFKGNLCENIKKSMFIEAISRQSISFPAINFHGIFPDNYIEKIRKLRLPNAELYIDSIGRFGVSPYIDNRYGENALKNDILDIWNKYFSDYWDLNKE